MHREVEVCSALSRGYGDGNVLFYVPQRRENSVEFHFEWQILELEGLLVTKTLHTAL